MSIGCTVDKGPCKVDFSTSGYVQGLGRAVHHSQPNLEPLAYTITRSD
jgi:hypothetical protein